MTHRLIEGDSEVEITHRGDLNGVKGGKGGKGGERGYLERVYSGCVKRVSRRCREDLLVTGLSIGSM